MVSKGMKKCPKSEKNSIFLVQNHKSVNCVNDATLSEKSCDFSKLDKILNFIIKSRVS